MVLNSLEGRHTSRVRRWAEKQWCDYDSSNGLVKEAAKLAYGNLKSTFDAIEVNRNPGENYVRLGVCSGNQVSRKILMNIAVTELLNKQEKLILPEIKRLLIQRQIPKGELDVQKAQVDLKRTWQQLAQIREIGVTGGERLMHRLERVSCLWRGVGVIVSDVQLPMKKTQSTSNANQQGDFFPESECSTSQLCSHTPHGYRSDTLVSVPSVEEGRFVSWLFEECFQVCKPHVNYFSKFLLFSAMADGVNACMQDNGDFNRISVVGELIDRVEAITRGYFSEAPLSLQYKLEEALAWVEIH